MDKPDFEALLRQIGGGVISKSVVINLCEHVWNTHVVPLQEKAKYWEQQYADLGKTAADHLEYANKKRLQNETLESDNKALREEIERLKAEVLKKKFPEN